ncbi:MAG: replication protein C [Acidobacteria bacterium]|nr:replication protein C [Acidobacteriota bacterium]MBV9479342.1 replication protein C [Acidobacteriota bacterium]
MDTENSTKEAPRRGSAYAPTGFRRLTPGLMKVDRVAEGFSGLPDGVTVYGQLLAAFKAAAPRLGIAPRLVHAIDWLFRFTQPQDWERDARPIVWPSALLQQEELGISESQAKRLNRCLIEFGLITMKDSPNGKRYGRRDARGRIVEAYGFDLSPLATRYQEFVQLAEEGRAERKTMGRLRQRATIARKSIVQILETARDHNLSDEEWSTLERDTQTIVEKLRRAARPDVMEAEVVSLERRQNEARNQLEMLLKDVKKTPSASKNAPHQYIYKQNSNPNKDTVTTYKAGSEPPDISVPSSTAPKTSKRPEKGNVRRIQPDELVRLAPRLKTYLHHPNPTWPEIIDAADWLRHDLDVSKPLWGNACVIMGRDLAALAIAIVSTKDPRHFRTTPGGYFHGMVQKAKAGELHLERTVWAMRRASQPIARPQIRRWERADPQRQ